MVAAGIFFLPAPDPGIVIIALGAALLAQESLLAVRALDWSEVRIRRLIAWGRRVWQQSGTLARTAIVLVGLAVGSADAYGAWWITFGR